VQVVVLKRLWDVVGIELVAELREARRERAQGCLPYAPGVVGQTKVLQFAKNVRESSLIIWVAE